MAKQIINIGTVANDGTGDPLRTAFDKANDNFTELYGAGSLSLASDIITFTKADGTTSTINISAYLDEDARAIASGTLNASTGIVTFTRDDASTFTIDLSGLKDSTGVDGVTIEYSLSNQLRVKANGISYDKMANEFTTSSVISASDVDFSFAQVFTKTLTANTTLTFSNVQTGMVKDLVITGDFTLTLPASVKTITGTYDGTVSNLIQIVSTNGSTEQWATISQEA